MQPIYFEGFLFKEIYFQGGPSYLQGTLNFGLKLFPGIFISEKSTQAASQTAPPRNPQLPRPLLELGLLELQQPQPLPPLHLSLNRKLLERMRVCPAALWSKLDRQAFHIEAMAETLEFEHLPDDLVAQTLQYVQNLVSKWHAHYAA